MVVVVDRAALGTHASAQAARALKYLLESLMKENEVSRESEPA
jgi:hypothetical protein